MNRLDIAISDVSYVLDSLIALRNIYQAGRSCNTCCNRECGYAPKLGYQVRWNCPHWTEVTKK